MRLAAKVVLVGILALAAFGCNRFIIYKGGKAYYFASKRQGLYKMLCESGDFKKVLEAAKTIPEKDKEDLWKYNCVEPSADKVQQIYTSMTPGQRTDLREAFKTQGYEINYFPCA
ncbi:MAG: hypothetical protein M0Z59_08360 [Nitrospiraceae bacterium]|nr:hypothetical protein [Nitrospiraceae bacterium]